jgi:PAP2 superfamily protein
MGKKPKPPYGLILLGSTWLLGMLCLIPVDHAWTIWIRRHRIRWLDGWMDQTLFEGEPLGGGDPVVLFLILVVWIYYLTWKKGAATRLFAWRPHLGFILVTALTSSVMMVHSLKWVMGRARPSLVFKGLLPFTDWFEFGPHFITEGTYRGSLPSGHTAQVFTLMTVTYILLWATPRFRYQRLIGWVWGGVSLSYTLLMGLTRCMKLSHWVSDVVFALGLSWILMHLIYDRLLKVPDQEAYYRQFGHFPDLPVVWELRLCLLLFATVLGGMAFMLGIRSSLLAAGWPLQISLLCGGILIMVYFGYKFKQFTSQIHSRLSQAPSLQKPLKTRNQAEPL